MQYSTLGTTDLRVSRICLGTMTWGSQNTEAEAFEQMDYALAQGVNFWDCAESYPSPVKAETVHVTETILGNWFKQNSGKRDEVVLASKISPRPFIRDGSKLCRHAIFDAVEGSLKRLQTDCLDLYQLHWPNRMNYHIAPDRTTWRYDVTDFDAAAEKETIHEVLQAIDECIKAGKIRYFGLSDDSAWGITTYAQMAEKFALPKVQSIQNEYSLLSRRSEYDVAETCVMEGVSFLPWSPFAMGILTGKYRDGAVPADPRARIHFGSNIQGRMHPNTDAAVTRYLDVAAKHNVSIAQMAIAFTLRKPWMTSSIIGASTMEQLRENIAAIDVALSEDCLADIQAVFRDIPVPY